MTKRILITIFFQIILFHAFSQSFCNKKHVYGLLSDFYYLQILPEQNYKLRVGMYSNLHFLGETEIKQDTLELSKLNRSYGAVRKMSKYQIKDSLLIPVAYKNKLPFSRKMSRDSSICKSYFQSDGHVYYELIFRSDSSFVYRTGSDITRNVTKGKWTQNGNEISLHPENSDHLLYWICTNNKLIEIDNYLVGRTYDKENETTEFQYLRGLKPRVNK
ncbi:hypothetical protein [Marinifilum caeruleilacunae]|uniref:DUF3108 domain-containing protein n=1 Tax=Marinifilum caeruleilacunae TaxID=2499076 RepID=A0ABX1X1P7_9BACT|nr:hypothetical protein [Marinifilum caeruleilacunae]NOU62000.1 hypothetical protein [Marinifilum caeruleilacunae]